MTYTPFKGFHEIDLPFFKKNKINIVDSPNNAQIIVSQKIKQLKPYFFKYRTQKKYLLWTLEPRFNTSTENIN
ncbi:MAG: glycosyl transferase, partial [Nonlabens sp.]